MRRVADVGVSLVRFEPSPHDCRVVVGVNRARDDGSATMDDRAALVLPWSIVKVLVWGLTAHLVAQEATHGPVRMPHGTAPECPALPLAEADMARIRRVWGELFPEAAALAGQPPEEVPH